MRGVIYSQGYEVYRSETGTICVHQTQSWKDSEITFERYCVKDYPRRSTDQNWIEDFVLSARDGDKPFDEQVEDYMQKYATVTHK